MKTLIINCCRDCPHFVETYLSDWLNRCNKLDRNISFILNEAKEHPDWCPLEDAPKEVSGDKQKTLYRL